MSPQSLLGALERRHELFCILRLFSEVLSDRSLGTRPRENTAVSLLPAASSKPQLSQKLPREEEALAGWEGLLAGTWEARLSAEWG